MFFVTYLPEFHYQPLKLSNVRPTDITNSKHTQIHIFGGRTFGQMLASKYFLKVSGPSPNLQKPSANPPPLLLLFLRNMI